MNISSDYTKPKRVILLDAKTRDERSGTTTILIAAVPFQVPMTANNVLDFALPCPQSGSQQWMRKDLYKLIHGSCLISFDAALIRNAHLSPLFADGNIAFPEFTGISLRDLTQRLLDPEAESCRSLETLSLSCGIAKPEPHEPRSAVFSMAMLLNDVLWPRLEERNLIEWDQIASFVATPWFPSRFAFGKYKGRHVQEASEDPELKAWLKRMSESNNSQSASMARWYLDQLSTAFLVDPGLVVYTSPELEDLQARIATAREQLAELDAEYTREHQAVAVVQSQLFLLLRPSYERRDQLRLQIDYRRRFLDALLHEGEEGAAKVTEQHRKARYENERSYEEASREASNTTSLNNEEQQELRSIYRRLAVLYHPDRYAQDPTRQGAYETLMKLINAARDSGQIDRLREIARDPNGFLLSQNLTTLDLHEDSEYDKLQLLLERLQQKIQEVQQSLDQLRQSSGYELWQLSLNDPNFIKDLAADQIKELEAEISELQAEANTLAGEIKTMTGKSDPFEPHAPLN